MRFTGRVALVTGGGHGIGRATVRRVADEGGAVAIADLDLEAAQSVAAERDAEAIALRCDVTDSDSVNSAVRRTVEHFGRLDILINVAGGASPQAPIDAMSDEGWQGELDLNLTGAMRCVRAAVPHLARSPVGGVIVSVSSVNGMTALGGEPYSAAKAGLIMFSRNLAIDLGPAGIRVNVVAPATIRTRVWEGQPGGADAMTDLYPLGRVGEPEDVAAAITFLASDDAAWITGVTLPVDGGLLTGPRQLLKGRHDSS